jgi:hypothetical protein
MPGNNMGNLNQGVNYMNQGQQPVAPVQPVAPQQPMMGQPMPAQPMPVQQPVAGNGAAAINGVVDKLKTNKPLMIGAIAGVAVVAVLVIVLGASLLNPSKNVVSKYMSGMKSFNAEKIAKLYSEEMLEAQYDGDRDDLVDELEEQFEEYEDEDYKITGYKIRECETYSEDELEDLAETLEEYYDIDEKDVKAAKKYFVRVNVDEDGEKNIRYNSVTVIKIKNKWSLYY